MFRNLLVASALLFSAGAHASDPVPSSTYDAELAAKLGADDYGMRSYVFVLLKTGPAADIPAEEQKAHFAGHFANIGALAEKGDLVLAGPLDGVNGLRGIFVLKTDTIEAAKEMMKGDPTIVNGIFTVDYHKYYGSAALILLNDWHEKIQKNEVQ